MSQRFKVGTKPAKTDHMAIGEVAKRSKTKNGLQTQEKSNATQLNVCRDSDTTGQATCHQSVKTG